MYEINSKSYTYSFPVQQTSYFIYFFKYVAFNSVLPYTLLVLMLKINNFTKNCRGNDLKENFWVPAMFFSKLVATNGLY